MLQHSGSKRSVSTKAESKGPSTQETKSVRMAKQRKPRPATRNLVRWSCKSFLFLPPSLSCKYSSASPQGKSQLGQGPHHCSNSVGGCHSFCSVKVRTSRGMKFRAVGPRCRCSATFFGVLLLIIRVSLRLASPKPCFLIFSSCIGLHESLSLTLPKRRRTNAFSWLSSLPVIRPG